MGFFYISDDGPIEGWDDAATLRWSSPAGDIDYDGEPEAQRGIARPIDAGRGRLVVDLSTVTFIDSTAIGVLVGAVMRLRRSGRGHRLRVVCAEENRRVTRIFEIAGHRQPDRAARSREEALLELTGAG